jgi:flagellin
MPTVINTNLASLFAQNSLSSAQNNLAQSVQRLSSGLRINSAKDDAAGLSISQNMQSQINGTNQSIRNLSDATNLLQVADSSLATVQDMLLRLKQLATQGYDGSLSTSQKLNIVQEMKDLNAEINATASRTAFNGINLLSSGSSVDLANSDIQAGYAVTNAAIGVDVRSASLGYYALGGKFASTGLGDSASSGSGINTTFSISIDPKMASKLPGSVLLTSNGSNLTMTGTINGLATSQTVVVADAVGNATGSTNKTNDQSLKFDQFGLTIDLRGTTGVGTTQTGATIATALAGANYRNLYITGKTADITDVSLSGVAPGSYSLSYTAAGTITGVSADLITAIAAGTAGGNTGFGASVTTRSVNITGGSGTGAKADITTSAGGVISTVTITSAGNGYLSTDSLAIEAGWDYAVTGDGGSGKRIQFTLGAGNVTPGTATNAKTLVMSGTVNGIATTQSLAIADAAANTSQIIDFSSFGAKFTLQSYQAQTGAQIVGALAALNSVSGTTAGQLIVNQGANSALKFQSGANSDAFIQINTLNVQTGTTGTYAGQSQQMMTMGTRISQTGAGNLGTLGNSDTIETWQTAFRNTAAAVDNALEYISTQRAVYGAQMNRLSYISTNLQAQSTNLQNSRSSIIDTDFAAETARLTKGQIMQQAATAMLAQANQMPNVILSLLK